MDVLVLGAGAIGLLVSAVAKVYGAQNVVIGDLNRDRVQFAEEHGFAHHGWTVDLIISDDLNDKLNKIKKMVARMTDIGLLARYDAVFECTGVESSLQTAIYVCTQETYLQYKAHGLHN